MKKQFLLISMIAASVFATFANKTIYVAPTAIGTKDGSSPANACMLNQVFGSLTPAVGLDATGTTTFNFDASAPYSITTSGSPNAASGCVLIPDNLTKKVIFEGNNAILNAGSNQVRMFRLGASTNVELRNLTFNNGFHTSGPGSLGGAVFFKGDSLKISGCTFNNCSADNGAALGSRGKYVKISNSWFKNNFLVTSFQGGAISHTGTSTGGSLIVENTTFSNNLGKAASQVFGSAIITAHDGETKNYLNTISINNCTFYKNKAGKNNGEAGYAAVELSYLGTTAPTTGVVTTATFVNNTFYGNSNCAIKITGKQQAVSLINNVIVGDSYDVTSLSGIQDHGIIAENSVAEGRPAIVAKNNYIVAKFPKSTKNDDTALATNNTDGNILVTTTSQNEIDALGLSTDLQTSGSPVPYLSTLSTSSPLVDGGINAVSGITMLLTDTRGIVRASSSVNTGVNYDIGAYENDNLPTAVPTVSENFFMFYQTGSEIRISNTSDKSLSVNMYLTNGQNIYSKTTSGSLIISKNQLPKGVMILTVSNGLKSVAKKIVL